MKFFLKIFVFSFLISLISCQQTPVADVKIVPARQYRMQKQDMKRIKDILETEIKQEIKTIEERWASNERLKDRAYGLPMTQFNPILGNSPPFPSFLTSNKEKEKKEQTEDKKKTQQINAKNEKLTDQLAKQLYLVNSAITQLKGSIDQSKRTLEKPITKMVNTIIHTPTNHNLVIPSRFQETNLTYSLTDSNLEPTEEKEVKNEEIPKKEEEKPIEQKEEQKSEEHDVPAATQNEVKMEENFIIKNEEHRVKTEKVEKENLNRSQPKIAENNLIKQDDAQTPIKNGNGAINKSTRFLNKISF